MTISHSSLNLKKSIHHLLDLIDKIHVLNKLGTPNRHETNIIEIQI